MFFHKFLLYAISGARLNHNQNVITSIYGLSPGSICNASFVPLYVNENKECHMEHIHIFALGF